MFSPQQQNQPNEEFLRKPHALKPLNTPFRQLPTRPVFSKVTPKDNFLSPLPTKHPPNASASPFNVSMSSASPQTASSFFSPSSTNMRLTTPNSFTSDSSSRPQSTPAVFSPDTSFTQSPTAVLFPSSSSFTPIPNTSLNVNSSASRKRHLNLSLDSDLKSSHLFEDEDQDMTDSARNHARVRKHRRKYTRQNAIYSEPDDEDSLDSNKENLMADERSDSFAASRPQTEADFRSNSAFKPFSAPSTSSLLSDEDFLHTRSPRDYFSEDEEEDHRSKDAREGLQRMNVKDDEIESFNSFQPQSESRSNPDSQRNSSPHTFAVFQSKLRIDTAPEPAPFFAFGAQRYTPSPLFESPFGSSVTTPVNQVRTLDYGSNTDAPSFAFFSSAPSPAPSSSSPVEQIQEAGDELHLQDKKEQQQRRDASKAQEKLKEKEKKWLSTVKKPIRSALVATSSDEEDLAETDSAVPHPNSTQAHQLNNFASVSVNAGISARKQLKPSNLSVELQLPPQRLQLLSQRRRSVISSSDTSPRSQIGFDTSSSSAGDLCSSSPIDPNLLKPRSSLVNAFDNSAFNLQFPSRNSQDRDLHEHTNSAGLQIRVDLVDANLKSPRNSLISPIARTSTIAERLPPSAIKPSLFPDSSSSSSSSATGICRAARRAPVNFSFLATVAELPQQEKDKERYSSDSSPPESPTAAVFSPRIHLSPDPKAFVESQMALQLKKKTPGSHSHQKQCPPTPTRPSLKRPSRLERTSSLYENKLLLDLSRASSDDTDVHDNIFSSHITFEDSFFGTSKVGSGSFFEVYSGYFKSDGRLYAIKKTLREYRGKKDREQYLREARLLLLVPSHENLLRYFTAWQQNKHIYFQTEYCKGSLPSYLETMEAANFPIDDKFLKFATVQLARGLYHIHRHGILHLDIKPDNILVAPKHPESVASFASRSSASLPARNLKRRENPARFRGSFCPSIDDDMDLATPIAGTNLPKFDFENKSNNSNNTSNQSHKRASSGSDDDNDPFSHILKLGDFGNARTFFDQADGLEGDSIYVAPELIEHGPSHLSPACDIFSLGLTLFEIATQVELPSSGPLWHELREGKAGKALHGHCGSEMEALILSMLDPDPSKRPTAETILKQLDSSFVPLPPISLDQIRQMQQSLLASSSSPSDSFLASSLSSSLSSSRSTSSSSCSSSASSSSSSSLSSSRNFSSLMQTAIKSKPPQTHSPQRLSHSNDSDEDEDMEVASLLSPKLLPLASMDIANDDFPTL